MTPSSEILRPKIEIEELAESIRRHILNDFSSLLSRLAACHRPVYAIRFVLFLADGPKSREQMVDLFRIGSDQKYEYRLQSTQRREKLLELQEDDPDAFVEPKHQRSSGLKDFSKKGKRKYDPLPANISKVAKDLHRNGIVRMYYKHPKGFNPFTKTGKIRPGSEVFYTLAGERITIRDWMTKCLQETDGILDDRYKPLYGELFTDLVDVTDYHANPYEEWWEIYTSNDKKEGGHKTKRLYKYRVPDDIRVDPIDPDIEIIEPQKNNRDKSTEKDVESTIPVPDGKPTGGKDPKASASPEPSCVYLDTETTKLDDDGHIVEIAIVDDDGNALINTLVNPMAPISSEAEKTHGISDEMVANQPTLDDIEDDIVEAVKDKVVVMYNAEYDYPLLPESAQLAMKGVCCAMRSYAVLIGSNWKKLHVAVAEIGYQWEGKSHRALSDALACRAVWKHVLYREKLPLERKRDPLEEVRKIPDIY
jgi:DNA polymerase III epsilon subunit-like protein